MTTPDTHLLEVRDLKTYFFTFEGTARAVDGLSYHLDSGEALGIVGESGCGKSVTAPSIMRIVPDPPGRIVSGGNQPVCRLAARRTQPSPVRSTPV